jgi:NADP-dependent 3-hydroxy acid dehydrogenase YdfG
LSTLKNPIALITGASSGIGQAIAQALSTPGTTLWLVGRDRGKLEVVAERARRTAAGVRLLPIDLVNDDDINELAKRLHAEVGFVDILVHCAGAFLQGPLASAPITALDHLYRVNVRAPYLLTQLLLPMLTARHGQIVFVNSSVGQTAPANVSQYAATKHALRAIADSLRQEVNADGVRVLSVYPGRTASPMQSAIHAMEGKTYDPDRLIQPEDVARVVVGALDLPRSAEVTDIHVRPFRKPSP